jgi:DNA-binding response OmpR family regulator
MSSGVDARKPTDRMRNALNDLSEASILILDRSPHQRAIVTGILRAAGCQILHVADDIEAGLERTRAAQPSGIIADWSPGGVDGLEFLRRLREGELDAPRATPVVLTTTRARKSQVELARASGVSEYVVRPMSAATLLTRVRSALFSQRIFIDSPNYVGPCRRRRLDEAYAGPFRRLSDPIEAAPDDPNEMENKVRARAVVAKLAEQAARTTPGDRRSLRSLVAAAQETRAIAIDIADGTFDRAAVSLLRYMEGVGASMDLDTRVIDAHVDALRQIVALPNAEFAVREQVADGLGAIVDKKLRRPNRMTR